MLLISECSSYPGTRQAWRGRLPTPARPPASGRALGPARPPPAAGVADGARAARGAGTPAAHPRCLQTWSNGRSARQACCSSRRRCSPRCTPAVPVAIQVTIPTRYRCSRGLKLPSFAPQRRLAAKASTPADRAPFPLTTPSDHPNEHQQPLALGNPPAAGHPRPPHPDQNRRHPAAACSHMTPPAAREARQAGGHRTVFSRLSSWAAE